MAQALEDACRAKGNEDSANCNYSEAVAQKMGSYQPNDYSSPSPVIARPKIIARIGRAFRAVTVALFYAGKSKKGRPVRTALLGLRLRASW